MKIQTSNLAGLMLIVPDFFDDHRGRFFEAFKKTDFDAASIPSEYLQSNISISERGTIRGLHFQFGNFAQGKLIRCVQGAIFDVALDLRESSRTFGKFEVFELSSNNHHSVFIPAGFAHGFQALTDGAVVHYQCTTLYNPANEAGINPLDDDLLIRWPINDPILSNKDLALPTFGKLKSRGMQ